jgi:hypothetical protein
MNLHGIGSHRAYDLDYENTEINNKNKIEEADL